MQVSLHSKVITIIEAFAELQDSRRRAGQRYKLPLCLALFTLALAAGENKGFLAIEDWFEAFEQIQPGAMAQAPAVGDRNALDTNGTQFVAN